MTTEPRTLDDPFDPTELEDALNRVLDETPGPEKPESEKGQPEKAEPEKAAPGEQPPEEPAQAAREPEKEPAPQYFEVDGKRYSADEIRELERGYVRRQEFDRSIQEVRAAQDELNERLDYLRELQQNQLRLGKNKAAEETGEQIEELEESAKQARGDEELQERVRTLETERAVRINREVAQYAVSVFDRTVDGLLKKYEIPSDSPVGELIRENTIAQNPTYRDERGRLLTDEQIARNTAQAFKKSYSRWSKARKAELDRVYQGLRPAAEKKPPATTGGPAPTPKPQDKREPRGMEPERDAPEFVEHLANLGVRLME